MSRCDGGRAWCPETIQKFLSGLPVAFDAAGYADRRIGTKRISIRLFNAAAILRNIAREWPS